MVIGWCRSLRQHTIKVVSPAALNYLSPQCQFNSKSVGLKQPSNTITSYWKQNIHTRNVPVSIHDMYSNLIADFSRFFITGPAQGEGLGEGGARPPPPPPPHFLEKIIILRNTHFSNKRNLWWNKNIRLANLAEASKFMIGPFRSYIIR